MRGQANVTNQVVTNILLTNSCVLEQRMASSLAYLRLANRSLKYRR